MCLFVCLLRVCVALRVTGTFIRDDIFQKQKNSDLRPFYWQGVPAEKSFPDTASHRKRIFVLVAKMSDFPCEMH
jgi:hypothetical protein